MTAMRNWAGTYAYRAPRTARPTDAAELPALLAGSGPVHALATRHSFTDLPDTEGLLVDLGGLADRIEVDDDAATARVTAWTRYGVLAQALEERGWALPNMGSLPHISVAGATATGTHGSGDDQRTLSAAVSSLTFLDAAGTERTVSRGDRDFPALVVGLGAFGVVTAVELDLVPSFRMRQDVYRGVTWSTLLADLDTVTAAGRSVSVFTRWEGEDLGFVWVKRLAGDPVAERLLDGVRDPDAAPLGRADNITELGVEGPWLLRLPHFRLDREPSFGAEIQSEYFVDRRDAVDALQAVRALAAVVVPHLIWTELRTVAADDLWLSPASGRDTFVIHFTWHDRPREVEAALAHVEAALEPFGARPHWGKVHLFDAARIARVHPRVADARAVLDRIDPGRRFANAHLERIGVR